MAGHRPPSRRIEFMDFTEDTSVSTYRLPEITEVAEIEYNGEKITIKKPNLVEIGIVGRGNFAENVMLCEVKSHPDLRMAVKKLNLVPSKNNSGDYTAQTDLRTIRAVGSGENPHVTKFYAGIRDKEEALLIICMELCDASMDRFATQMHAMERTEHLDLLLRRMIDHIADALRFMKSKQILHRDVKPSNILVNKSPLLFKLCDFGIAGELIGSVAKTLMKGTECYLAPERVHGELAPNGYGVRSDMWALGISIVEIAANKNPFHGCATIVFMQELKTWKPQPLEQLSTDLQTLVTHLLQHDHTKRPATYDEILASPAIKSLPKEVTSEELKLVAEVVPQIPVIRDE